MKKVTNIQEVLDQIKKRKDFQDASKMHLSFIRIYNLSLKEILELIHNNDLYLID